MSTAARAARLAAASIAILVMLGILRRAMAADEPLLLEVVVNGYSTEKIAQFVLRGGALYARPTELHDLGFRLPEGVPPTSREPIPMSALAGVSARLDQGAQTLYVTAPIDRLLPKLLHAAKAGGGIPVESGLGATLDYDSTDTYFGGQVSASGLFDLRGFSPWGVVSSGLLTHLGAGATSGGSEPVVRLDTVATYSDVDHLRQYRIGDFINGGLVWTRPVRLGGIQAATDFALRPDLITYPLPVVSGSVAVPSTVNVLVNNLRVLSRQVQPGPFEIPQLPVATGAGTVSLTVTNALGRQVTTTLPFYASSSLLVPGLQSFSAEAGAVRRNWGVVSNDYGTLAGSVTFRRGLSRNLTVEAHGEATDDLAMAGAGMVVGTNRFGVVNFAAAASSGAGGSGTQLALGAQRQSNTVSLGANAILASRRYGDFASRNADPVPRLQFNANGGLSLGRFGSLGLALTAVDQPAQTLPESAFAPPGTIFPPGAAAANGSISLPAARTRIATVSYSLQLGPLSIYATLFHDLTGDHATGASIGLTVPLGPRRSASLTATGAPGSNGIAAQAQQSAVSVGDWGYQAYSSFGEQPHQFVELDYKSSWGRLSGGADRIGHRTTLQAETRGAVSFVDDAFFLSNSIDDSFAIVDTNGAAGVPVLFENREIGKTGSDGRLLVPDLRSFEINHVAIDATAIPLDIALPATERRVRPQYLSGVVVKFPLQPSHGALLHLVDGEGKPLPVGSVARVAPDGEAVPVGYDGEAYVQLEKRHFRVDVERPHGRRCTAAGSYRPRPGQIPTIGPLVCRSAEL